MMKEYAGRPDAPERCCPWACPWGGRGRGEGQAEGAEQPCSGCWVSDLAQCEGLDRGHSPKVPNVTVLQEGDKVERMGSGVTTGKGFL